MNILLLLFLLIILYFIFNIKIFFKKGRKDIKIALDNKLLVPEFKKIFLFSDLNIKYSITKNKDESLKLLKKGVVDFALLREDQDIKDFKFICALYKEYLMFLINLDKKNKIGRAHV